MSDAIASVGRDLIALSAPDRRAILAAFDSDDRDRLRAAMRRRPAPEPSGSAVHSTWFGTLLQKARNPRPGTSPSPAACAALLDALGSAGGHRAPGRSLLQAAGGVLAGARAR